MTKKAKSGAPKAPEKAKRTGAHPATLNVVFHGLWAFETQPKGILAHTAVEKEHKIKAGSWATPKKLTPGDHKLEGVAAGTDNDFEKKQNPIVKNKPLKSSKNRYCVVKLPAAKSIRSIRRVEVQTLTPFEGKDGKKLHPQEVSMLQVFIYDVPDPAKVALSGLAWKPKWKDGIGSLHVFAQPDRAVHPEHFKTAYHNLGEMFGLDITPVEELFTAPEDPGVPGLSADDTRGLHERGGMGGGHGHAAALRIISGANCDALVVNNAGLKK